MDMENEIEIENELESGIAGEMMMSNDLVMISSLDDKHQGDSDKIHCVCKQPYDNRRFYICCSTCKEWFHGGCVGILQSEVVYIDTYICHICEPNSEINRANFKLFEYDNDDYQHLSIFLKEIKTHKCSGPFLEPVDADEAANYYRITKKPMDLETIEMRVEEMCYFRLQCFIFDLTKIFENCRYYYNPVEAPDYAEAETLESFIAQKIPLLRQKLL